MKFTRIRSLINAYYLVLLLVSMLVSSLLYQRINVKFTEEKISEVSMQTLNAIHAGVESLTDSANNYSQMIAANNTVQAVLSNPLQEDIAISTGLLKTALYDFMLAEPSISSIHLFDNYGNNYDISHRPAMILQVSRIESTEWYQEVVDKHGKAIWRKNAGGIYKLGTNDTDFISLIRVINDLNNSRQIGIIVINIPVSELKKSYERSVNADKPDLMIESEHETLIGFERPSLTGFNDSDDISIPPVGSVYKTVGGQRYLFSIFASPVNGWKLTSAQPLGEWASPYKQFNLVLFLIMLFNFLFLFIGSVWISRVITMPILHLLRSMKKVEFGEFNPVQFEAFTDELKQLRDRYNNMIATTEQALIREKEEQATIRRLELDILQQQIKPHFLYNTLESAGYLALSGSNRDAYSLITALASYYRRSLSKGSEVITLKQEIEIARNYLKIQGIRYPNIFNDEYVVDKEAEDILIPKLSLQPLVENALYHGIRQLGQCGVIKILANIDGRRLKVTVADDGVGMDSKTLEKLTSGQTDGGEASFGLQGTLRRLQLYYGKGMSYTIESAPGKGTIISLFIPLWEGRANGRSND
ncbi:sensor histidine kinase [Cohnella suwonensis]|uniref:Sensor histidine kinase n=1 Tax=Cohnella suwonensis TaxID=696072 RepID=A0ABW0LWJ0_9BACL